MATREQANKEYARRWNEEIWGKQNLDAIDDLIAKDFVEYGTLSPEPTRGPEGVRASVEMILSAFPDTHVELEDIVAEGDVIAIRATAIGTHEGELMGIEPTGKTIEMLLMAFQRIENGKAVEEWQLVDWLGLLQQLGAIDPPGE